MTMRVIPTAAILPLIAPAVDVARDAGITLVVETGNGTMVNSNYTGRKLIDDLDAKDAKKEAEQLLF